MIMIDSNMWIYYFDESLEEHKHVKEPIREIILEKRILANTVVIQEVAHYLIRHEPVEEFQTDMNYLIRLKSIELLDFDYAMMQKALKLLSKYWNYGIGGRDAVLLATMVMKEASEIMTHDKAFKKLSARFDEIENFSVFDPIPEKNYLAKGSEA